MRLKTISAANMAEGMRLVRETLGDEAIIVSSQPGDSGLGVRITAAVEELDPIPGSLVANVEVGVAPAPEAAAAFDVVDVIDVVADALDFHRTPIDLSERIVDGATMASSDDPVMTLAAGLDAVFSFRPLSIAPGEKPAMLVGPPGVGKTVCTAKLAAQAVLQHRPVAVICSDTVRTGAGAQISDLTAVLRVGVDTADTPDALRRLLDQHGRDSRVLIDSAGVNPFDSVDMDRLQSLLLDGAVEPVLVLNAGRNPADAAEMAMEFHAIGVRRMIATQLDIARRLGGILAPAAAGPLSLAQVSVSPNIADGLNPINPVALARLLLPHQSEAPMELPRTQVGSP
jgi:flagellar biosynthesis protein FlhF